MPDVTVIIPVRDDAAGLQACLDALAAQEGAPALEVVVVDNGSRDGTADVASRHPIGARVVTEQQRGSYAARNRGLAEATSPVLAFLDADCVPEPDWLRHALAARRDGTAVAGRVRMPVSPRPTWWEQWDAAHYLDQETYVQQGYAATANLVVQRDAFDAAGPFDAELLSSGDLEWGQRATRAGFRFVYAPDAVVRHRPRTTLVQTWRLHRRLGAGWRVLARRGERPRAFRDPWMNPTLGVVHAAAQQQGLPARRRELAVVHAVVLAARWYGRALGR